jgi:AcrR family transcriptional regulator
MTTSAKPFKTEQIYKMCNKMGLNEMEKSVGENSRARKAIQKAFVALYKEYPLEKISVKMIVEQAEYSRSVFYFHYQDVYELLENMERQFFLTVGDYYDFSYLQELAQDIEQERVPSCTVKWYERCLNYIEFLAGALSDHGNYLFELKLREKLKTDWKNMAKLENVPDDNRTKLIIEYQVEGIIGLLRIATDQKQIKDITASELAEVSNTMRKYWHYANRKPHDQQIRK